MPELTDDERRRGREYMAELMAMAPKAPDTFAAIVVNKAVSRLQNHYGYSAPAKMDAIVRFAEKAGDLGATPGEIIEHFQWPKDDIYDLVKELVTAGRLEECRTPAINSTGRGRPAMRYRAIFSTPKN